MVTVRLRDAPRRFKRLAIDVGTNVEVVVRRVAILAFQGVVLATPVLTGRARSGWDVSVGGPVEVERGGIRSPGEIIQTGREAVNAYRLGSSIWLSNNVPYIVPLNSGHSAQAPSGFVQIAIQQARDAILGVRIVEVKLPDG